MQDACDPPPHHIHPIVHHHPQAPVIGRIRRHGTHRLAQRLHAAAGVCPAGPPLVIGAAALKAVLPAMAFVGLTTLASSVSAPSVQPAADGFNAAGAGAFGVVGTSALPAVAVRQVWRRTGEPTSLIRRSAFPSPPVSACSCW